MLNPAAEKLSIDPRLVADTRSVRQRIASARFRIDIGERTAMETLSHMLEWREAIQISERKLLRKTILDLSIRFSKVVISHAHRATQTGNSAADIYFA